MPVARAAVCADALRPSDAPPHYAGLRGGNEASDDGSTVDRTGLQGIARGPDKTNADAGTAGRSTKLAAHLATLEGDAMRVLIADDDVVLRLALRTQLARWAYEIVECADGREAWDVLQAPDVPPLGIIDWNMPGMDGPTLCRGLRELPGTAGMYVILLTGNRERRDVITGLESGADDYITKPFHWNELRARLRIGTRIVGLQGSLAAQVMELQEVLSKVRRLSGLLPICAYCKRVRDDKDYWQQIEHYLAEHSDARFSHGICPKCMERELASEVTESGPQGANT